MIVIIFGLIPLVLGVFAPLWFGQMIPSVRRLRKGAIWLDAESVRRPLPEQLTIQSLREHETCGDRIVVAHHLADWTRDLQRKITHHLGYGTVLLFIIVIGVTVLNDETLQSSTTTFDQFLVAVRAHWPISLMLVPSLIEIVIFLKLVSDQAAKYTKVIKAAKPPRTATSGGATKLFKQARTA